MDNKENDSKDYDNFFNTMRDFFQEQDRQKMRGVKRL